MAKNRLRQIRHEMLIDDQKTMAELLFLSPAQYHRYERCKSVPSLDVALKIAEILGKKVEDIFYLDDKPID